MTLHLYTRRDSQGASNAQYSQWIEEVKKRESRSSFFTACAMVAVVIVFACAALGI